MKKLLYGLILLGTLSCSAIIAKDCCNSCCSDSCNSCCSNNSCCGCNSCGCNSCNDCDSCLSPCSGYPFLLPRSQGRNSAREIVGWQEFINRENKRDYSGAMYAAVEYAQTFKPCQLAQFLFGADVKTDCCGSELKIQGSQVTNRNSKAWLADYFGLSPYFDSTVNFCPKIQNTIVDLNFFLALDKWADGLFVRLDMPLAWTQTNLGMYEIVHNSGNDANGVPAGFAAGYMSSSAINRNALPDNLTQVMCGTTTFGDMLQPIKFGKMTNCNLTAVGIADLRGTLGYNFVMSDKGHFGIYGVLAAPTGTRPHAWYLFEPIIGNGKHWELGGGLTSSWIFHRCTDDNKRYLGLWFDATVTHLFKSNQCRSFDFNCMPNSRYMLLEQMGANKDGIQAVENNTAVTTNYQYQRSMIPAINWATFCTKVSIGVQADLAIKMAYVRDNWNFDIGYDFWARSGEKFCNSCCNNSCGCNSCCNTCCSSCTTCTTTQTEGYAIKGDAYIYGQDAGLTVYPLSATEHSATIYSGTDLPLGVSYLNTNTAVDNPGSALNRTSGPLFSVGTANYIKTSQPSVLAQKCNLNMCKSPSAITHKVFSNISYAWKEASARWIPFLGIGGEAEFAQGAGCCKSGCGCGNCCNSCSSCTNTSTSTSCTNSCGSCCNNNCGCNSCCNSCCPEKRASISQWGIWLKGGVKFD